MGTHARNDRDTASISKPDHLLGHRLRRHKDPRDIDFKHQVRILGRIFQRRRLLLDPRRSNQSIQPPPLLTNRLHNSIQPLHIPHIDLAVVEGIPQLVRRPALHPREIRRRLRQPVERVHRRARFQQGFRLRQAQPAPRARYQHDLVRQVELREPLARAEEAGGRGVGAEVLAFLRWSARRWPRWLLWRMALWRVLQCGRRSASYYRFWE